MLVEVWKGYWVDPFRVYSVSWCYSPNSSFSYRVEIGTHDGPGIVVIPIGDSEKAEDAAHKIGFKIEEVKRLSENLKSRDIERRPCDAS